MSTRGIDRAVKAAGSQANLARTLGVSEAYVSAWVKRGWISSKYVVAAAALYEIPPKDLVNPTLVALIEGA